MQGPSFEQTRIPFTQGCFVPSLVEIDSVVLEKMILNFVSVFCYLLINSLWNIWTTMMTKTTMDNGKILIRKAHLSIRLRWAKNWWKMSSAGQWEKVLINQQFQQNVMKVRILDHALIGQNLRSCCQVTLHIMMLDPLNCNSDWVVQMIFII